MASLCLMCGWPLHFLFWHTRWPLSAWCDINICAATWENLPSDMCFQRRFKSACTSTQSDQNLCCPHKELLHLWPPNTVQWRVWSDCMNVQVDMNLHWVQGWSGGAKVLCILHHRGVQLILAYSWARPAILVVGKGRGGMFLFLLFLHFHSCSSFFPVPLFHLLYSLFYLFSPFLWETTQNDPQGLTCR